MFLEFKPLNIRRISAMAHSRLEAKNMNQDLKKKLKVKVRDIEKSKKRENEPPKNSRKGKVITLSFFIQIACLNMD